MGDERAFRFDPDYGVFAAMRDDSLENVAALGRLIPAGGSLWVVERDAIPSPPGAAAEYRPVSQMIAEAILPDQAAFEIVPLTDADAPAMLALATLTEPGPFFARTNRLGAFIGIKQDGVLVAMAGERMRPTGFTEVSGVCTRPDQRGRGYAGGLMREVARRILARGETPFLHVYPENGGAIALYETLGFRLRAEMKLTRLSPPQNAL